MEHRLKSGMVLDGRYRIERVLGEGGFGITYAAENIRIGLRVAVKEFYWHDHSTRDVDVSPSVSLSDAADEEVFQAQKERFLKEARILRDFSNLAGIVHITDYFEENDTAYIVMEYIEGVTLDRFLSEHGGQMDPEILLRRMLPLIDSLDQIHKSGVIHRDISPDNIMVAPDGALKIIDFGAARQLTPDKSQFTAITTACYAPCEQYDKNGRQGPWTDVYALCATLYRCVTGAPPESAIQRMFLDELKTPAQLGVPIRPEYEAIIMKGLQVDASKRYPSMEALASALRSALPKEEIRSDDSGGKKWLVRLVAGFVCLAVLVGAWLYTRHADSNKFRGIETERLRLTAPSNMTAAEFADAQQEVRKWLEYFAGRDNYIMSVDGAHIDITVPLSVYDNREIGETTVNSFIGYAKYDEEKPLKLVSEIKANWEDPATSLIAGKNQVLPDAFHEETLIFSYGWSGVLTPGQRANALVDFKTRLDALDVPYAFGTLYGNDDVMVFCLPPQRVGRVILDTLGQYNLYISGEILSAKSIYLQYNEYAGSSPLTPIWTDDGAGGFRYERQSDSDKDLESLTRVLLKNDEHKVYLRSSSGYNLAVTEIDSAMTDGRLDFSEIMVTDFDPGDARNVWLYRYVDAVLNQTSLPQLCRKRDGAVRGADGSPLFDAAPEDYYGIHTWVTDGEIALQETLERIESEEGLKISMWNATDGGVYYSINLGLEPGKALVEDIDRVLPALIEKYNLNGINIATVLYILPMGEIGGERCRIMLSSRYDYDTEEIHPSMSAFFTAEGRTEPYLEDLDAWWEGFDAEALGFRKNT